MCGFGAEIQLDGSPASLNSVEKMLPVLEPRGPDAEGMFLQGRIAVGHRRLKIIDLSEKAQQPMVDSQLGLGIVFNGCIYNYKELRKELEGKGYRFFSTGDTEVLVKAYHAWGEDFVSKLNGMFAFFLWERDSGRVLVGRDRLGIKPVYYSETNGQLRFSSTLPALLATEGIDKSIDPEALHFYMSLHAVVPAPWTIVKGVRKLPPGTLMKIEKSGRVELKSFWSLSFDRSKEDQEKSFQDWKAELTEELRASVLRRMTADVPVGVLLSGGLDSSLVVGLLKDAGQENLHTFSIGFETVGDEKGDEFEYSDVIADHFKTQHHRIFIESHEALDNLSRCIRSMSEPMVSHDVIGFYLLSREVSKHIKVVQSGQGADEVFAGYHWYPPMMESQDPVNDYAKVFLDRSHEEMAETLNPEFLSANITSEYIKEHFAQSGAKEAIDKTLRIDTTTMLIDDPVKRVDNMTMSWGLEARVPFLDHELVEFAARIPAKYKVQEGGKYILKEVARDFIPNAVIDRPKGYFPVPALKFLQGPYLERVRESLLGQVASNRALFNKKKIETLLEDPEKHITPLQGSKLWQMALLEEWLREQKI